MCYLVSFIWYCVCLCVFIMDWLSSHVAVVLFILTFLAYGLPNKNFLYGFPHIYGITRKALKKRVSGSS